MFRYLGSTWQGAIYFFEPKCAHSAQGLNNLAVIYTSQGRAQEALQTLQAATLADPNYAEVWRCLYGFLFLFIIPSRSVPGCIILESWLHTAYVVKAFD